MHVILATFVIHPDHKVVEIALFKRSIKLLEKRYCPLHKEQELTIGCPRCYKTFCIKCLPESKQCEAGKKNGFLAIIGYVNDK